MGTESLATVGNPGGGLAVQSGEVDLQISTAKRYPRSISTFMERAGKLATRNVEIAARCRYVLTRKKKGGGTTEIVGPSIRLAEIVEQTWGNIRLQARIDDETETYVLVSCLAWDLESNVANVVQVRRSIVGSNGHRYSDDMVNTATMAALAICRRNAILSIVPGAYTAELLDTCMKLITSGGSGSAAGRAESVKTRAKRVLEWMADRGVTEQQVLTLLDLRTLTRIKGDHVATLEGIRTAVEDGQTTLETTFGNPAEESAPPEEVDPKGSERASTDTNGQQEAAPAGAFNRPPMGASPKPAAARQPTPAAPADGAHPDVIISRDEAEEVLSLADEHEVGLDLLVAHLRDTYGLDLIAKLTAADLPSVQAWIRGGGKS